MSAKSQSDTAKEIPECAARLYFGIAHWDLLVRNGSHSIEIAHMSKTCTSKQLRIPLGHPVALAYALRFMERSSPLFTAGDIPLAAGRRDLFRPQTTV